MKIKYVARKGSQFKKAEAEKYGKEIMRLSDENGGSVTPEILIGDAESPKSPLHDYFIWDNDEAAHRFRLVQARHLIMHIEIVEIEQSRIVATYRIMHNVTTERGRAYVPVTEIRMRQDYQDELAERCKEDFLMWADQYDEIIDLFNIKTKIEQFKSELSAAVKTFVKKRKLENK